MVLFSVKELCPVSCMENDPLCKSICGADIFSFVKIKNPQETQTVENMTIMITIPSETRT
jgi:hypothetical protein